MKPEKAGSLLLFLFIYLNLVKETFAQPMPPELKIRQPEGTGAMVDGRTGSTIVQNVYSSIVTIIFSVAIVAFLIMLIWGAFDIIVSGGNKDKIQAGRKRITTAIIGITLLAFSFFIARVVGDIIGINISPESPLRIPRLLDGGAARYDSSGTSSTPGAE